MKVVSEVFEKVSQIVIEETKPKLVSHVVIDQPKMQLIPYVDPQFALHVWRRETVIKVVELPVIVCESVTEIVIQNELDKISKRDKLVIDISKHQRIEFIETERELLNLQYHRNVNSQVYVLHSTLSVPYRYRYLTPALNGVNFWLPSL